MRKTAERVKAEVDGAGPFDLTRLVSYRIDLLGKLLARDGGATYMDAIGLALPQWRVISTLGLNGELAPTAIADHVNMDRGQTSRTLDQLIAAGLVRMRPDIEDGRRTLFSLSREGESRYRAGMPVALKRQKELLQSFSQDQVVQFGMMLDQMIADLSAKRPRR